MTWLSPRVLCCALALWAASARARDRPASPTPSGEGALRLSIADALRRAEAVSEQIAIARARIRRAEGQLYQARSGYFPQLSAQASYDRTLASEFEGLFEDGPGGGAGFPGGGLEELPFGQENIWRAGLSFSQNLYAGGATMAQVDIARATERNAEMELAQARASIVLEAAQAYFDAALADRLLEIAEATLRQAEDTLAQTKVGRQVGARPEFDLLRAQVAVENQRPTVLQRRMDRDLAYLRLKQLLEIPPGETLHLTTPVDRGELSDLVPLAIEVADAPPPDAGVERVAVRQADENVRINEAALRLAWSQHLPQVSLVSSYGLVNYPSAFFPDFSDWRTNWTVGVVLQVPLFTGLRIRGGVITAEADLAEAVARRRQAEELARVDTETAREQLATAKAVWEASAHAVKQAARAFEIAELRYQEGVSTQLELNDARLQLELARANRARAARDLQVARVRLALLPNLPVTTVGASEFAGAATFGAAVQAPSTPQAPAAPAAAAQGRGPGF